MRVGDGIHVHSQLKQRLWGSRDLGIKTGAVDFDRLAPYHLHRKSSQCFDRKFVLAIPCLLSGITEAETGNQCSYHIFYTNNACYMDKNLRSQSSCGPLVCYFYDKQSSPFYSPLQLFNKPHHRRIGKLQQRHSGWQQGECTFIENRHRFAK